jgi:hypothetical protein
MSKTIRRRGSKLPWWYGLSGSQPWEWYNDKTCKDKWIGPKTATKAYTRERRRSDERQMVENIKKDVETTLMISRRNILVIFGILINARLA